MIPLWAGIWIMVFLNFSGVGGLGRCDVLCNISNNAYTNPALFWKPGTMHGISSRATLALGIYMVKTKSV